VDGLLFSLAGNWQLATGNWQLTASPSKKGTRYIFLLKM
jgi:hypothetical protein